MDYASQSSSDIASADELRNIISRNDLLALRRHLAAGGCISSVDSKGRNLLMIAASAGDARLEMVRLLIAHRAEVDTQQYQGITALMFACMTGASLVALQLVAAKANAEMQDDHGLTASGYARLKGHEDLVALLLRHVLRADDDASNASTRRATQASESSAAAVCIDVAAAGTGTVASMIGQPEPATPAEPLLPTLPAALLEAAQQGDCDAVQAYLSSGGSPDAVDEALRGSMLHAACSSGHTPLATLLLEAHASVNLCDTNGCTALSVACFAMAHGSVALLLAASASVDCQDAVGLTPLMVAALSGSLPLTRTLLAAHASRELRDKHGQTALSYAQIKGHLAVAALLRRRTVSRAGGGRTVERRTTPEDDELAARAADALLVEEQAAAAHETAAATKAKAKRRARKKRQGQGARAAGGDADSSDASSLDPSLSSPDPSCGSDASGAASSMPLSADEYSVVVASSGAPHDAPGSDDASTHSFAASGGAPSAEPEHAPPTALEEQRPATGAAPPDETPSFDLPPPELPPAPPPRAPIPPAEVTDQEAGHADRGASSGSMQQPGDEAAAAVTLRAELEALQRRLCEQEERTMCVVCLEQARSHVLLPCGHKCLCTTCVETVLGTGADAVCPLCRSHIQSAQRVFDS